MQRAFSSLQLTVAVCVLIMAVLSFCFLLPPLPALVPVAAQATVLASGWNYIQDLAIHPLTGDIWILDYNWKHPAVIHTMNAAGTWPPLRCLQTSATRPPCR
jgi:hypothetical protein